VLATLPFEELKPYLGLSFFGPHENPETLQQGNSGLSTQSPPVHRITTGGFSGYEQYFSAEYFLKRFYGFAVDHFDIHRK
jgi:hypothetical protein